MAESKDVLNIDVDNCSNPSAPNSHKSDWNIPLKDKIPASNMEDPLDKVIYEEFVELLLSKIKQYQPGISYDLKKIVLLLLDGATPKEICIEMGMSLTIRINNAMRTLRKIRKDILLPICLSIIDDERYTDKYWEVLNKKGKSLYFSQKKPWFSNEHVLQ